MNSRALLLGTLLAGEALSLCGCASVTPPRLLHPGSAQTQRLRAEEFDPYPLPELGPPTEARPRGFLLPAPDAERMANAETFAERFHTPPPPGVYRTDRSMPAAVPFVPPPAVQTPSVFVP
jgi:hypothetical protein